MTSPTDPAVAPAIHPTSTERDGLPFRPAVLLVGVLALVGMVGSIAFFGDRSDSRSIRATHAEGGGGAGTPPGAPPEPVEIKNPAALAPPGGVPVPPSQPGATMEWKTRQDWATVLAGYYAAFPVEGMALDPKPNGASSRGGVPTGEMHQIISADASSTPGLSPYLVIEQDPDNPSGSTVSLYIYD